MSKAFPYGKAIGVGKGNAVLDAGSFMPSGPDGPRPRGERAPALGEQLPDGRREALQHRASAVRRRPADRLHLPGPDAGGRHQLARRAGARRDRAGLRRQHPDRPRAGLRVEPDLGGLGPDRHLRRDPVRRLATKYRYKGRCRTMGTRRRGRDQGFGRVVYRTTVHGPVTGYAKVGGRPSRSRASGRASARTSSGSSRSAT